jgi:hypothetical protein
MFMAMTADRGMPGYASAHQFVISVVLVAVIGASLWNTPQGRRSCHAN